jgi:hypothetical protein
LSIAQYTPVTDMTWVVTLRRNGAEGACIESLLRSSWEAQNSVRRYFVTRLGVMICNMRK